MHKKKQQHRRSLKGGSSLNNQEVWYRGVSSTQYVQRTVIFSYYSKYCSIPGSAHSRPGDVRFLSITAHFFFLFFFKDLRESQKFVSSPFSVTELSQDGSFPPVPAAHPHSKSLCGPWWH